LDKFYQRKKGLPREASSKNQGLGPKGGGEEQRKKKLGQKRLPVHAKTSTGSHYVNLSNLRTDNGFQKSLWKGEGKRGGNGGEKNWRGEPPVHHPSLGKGQLEGRMQWDIEGIPNERQSHGSREKKKKRVEEKRNGHDWTCGERRRKIEMRKRERERTERYQRRI